MFLPSPSLGMNRRFRPLRQRPRRGRPRRRPAHDQRTSQADETGGEKEARKNPTREYSRTVNLVRASCQRVCGPGAVGRARLRRILRPKTNQPSQPAAQPPTQPAQPQPRTPGAPRGPPAGGVPPAPAAESVPVGNYIDDGFTWFEAVGTEELDARHHPVTSGWYLNSQLRLVGDYPGRSAFKVVVSRAGRALATTRCEAERYEPERGGGVGQVVEHGRADLEHAHGVDARDPDEGPSEPVSQGGRFSPRGRGRRLAEGHARRGGRTSARAPVGVRPRVAGRGGSGCGSRK